MREHFYEKKMAARVCLSDAVTNMTKLLNLQTETLSIRSGDHYRKEFARNVLTKKTVLIRD